MEKIILLDWGGPVCNARTSMMPNQVDPVAIQMLNDLTAAGWKTVLTSDVRQTFESDDPLKEAKEFMRRAGFFVQFADHWRTDPNVINTRHLEVAALIQVADFPDDAVFLVVDDLHFPHEFLRRGRMSQIHASTTGGIDYLSLSEAYRIMAMSDAELDEHFTPEEDE